MSNDEPQSTSEKASPSSLQSVVFAQRGTLLAIPAVALALRGRPSALSNAIGIPLAFVGEALRCWAVGFSGKTTRGNKVEAPRLTTNGPYAYVRNPLYIGNAITALGFAIAFTGKFGAATRTATIAATMGIMASVYSIIVPHEESYLQSTFGESFELYCERVGRVFPRTTPYSRAEGEFDPSVIASAESRTFVTFGLMLAALALRSREQAA